MSESIQSQSAAGGEYRNLIVCSDGTGNAGGRSRPTNVWRIFNLIERRGARVEQIAYYDDGVGTEDVKPLKLLGGAVGYGFTRNLIDLYSFLALNYRPGDRIFLFGFSRGAFTVRTLASLIVSCGLIERKHFLAERQPRKMVKKVVNAYRSVQAGRDVDLDVELAAIKDPESRQEIDRQVNVPIHFVGVFDTVDAVGVPFDGVQDFVNGITKLVFRRKLYGFGDQKLDPLVKHGCQALSIDDERQTFHPNVWDDRDGIEQVWFAGAHSNVGGGYPRDGMALVSLEWMMEKASEEGLFFSPHALQGRVEDSFGTPLDQGVRSEYAAVAREITKADVDAKLYNPRKGLGVFYRYAPRKIPDGSKLHVSVYQRIRRGTERYAPLKIPDDAAAVASQDGPYSTLPGEPLPRLQPEEKQQIERLTDTRSKLYGIFMMTVIAVAVVIATALYTLEPGDPGALHFKALAWLLPDRLVALMEDFPWLTLAIVALFSGLFVMRVMLRKAIHATAFRSWRRALAGVGWEEAPLDAEALKKRSGKTVTRTKILTVAYKACGVVCVGTILASALMFVSLVRDEMGEASKVEQGEGVTPPVAAGRESDR